MGCCEVQWIPLGLLVIMNLVLILLLYLQLKTKNDLIRELQKEKRDLLNRLMSGDLRTYIAMSTQNQPQPSHPSGLTSSYNYYSMSDEAELNRMSNPEIDDATDLMMDFGLGH